MDTTGDSLSPCPRGGRTAFIHPDNLSDLVHSIWTKKSNHILLYFGPRCLQGWSDCSAVQGLFGRHLSSPSVRLLIIATIKFKQFLNIQPYARQRINPCGGIIAHKNLYNSNLALLCNNTQTAEGGITEGLLSLNRMLQLPL